MMSGFKIKGENFDVVEDNISKLKDLFPEMVTGDGEIDFDGFKELFEKSGEIITDDYEEHYKFTWWGKKKAKNEIKKTTAKTLRPSKKDSKNWDTTKNIYIEGDNLDALKILLDSYRDSIKMIYIDPPYNTGHDFVYKDDRTESTKEHLESTGQLSEEGFLYENAKTDGKYHSNWLNMMYPRLVLARKLLRNDGVIFISIDDNEFHNLKKICDEIFNEKNYLGDIIWNSTKSVTNTALISVSHTYNLIYFKNKDYYVKNRSEFRLPDDGSGFSNPDNDPRGPWKADPFQVGGWRPNQQYEIVNPNTGKVYTPNPDCSWKNDYEKFQELLKDNRIVFGKDGTGGPLRKRFLFEAKERGKVTKTWWDDVETTTNGTMHLKKLFDNKIIFNNPKPVGLIKKMLNLCTSNEDIILDFFSGSATTAESVIRLNSEDNFYRQFIMVQIPEPTDEKSITYKEGYENICEIGKERIRRAGDKIVDDESNFIPWNPVITSENVEQAILSTADNLVQGRSELDLVYELLLKEINLGLNCPIDETIINGKKVYIIDNGYALICLENKLDASIADDLLNLKEELMVDYSEVILKDEALDDTTSINIFETLNSNGMDFKTI